MDHDDFIPPELADVEYETEETAVREDAARRAARHVEEAGASVVRF